MHVKQKLLEYLSRYNHGYNNTGAMRWLYRNHPDLWSEVVDVTSFLNEAKPKQRAWHILNDCFERVYMLDGTGNQAVWQGSKYYRYSEKGGHMADPICVASKIAKFREKYGVDNAMQVPEFKQKLEQVIMDKYGSSNYFKTAMGKLTAATCRADNELQQQRRDNIRKTMVTRYGVEYPCQNAEIQERILLSSRKYKEYTMPSGRVIKVQGYEPRALDELLLLYTEDQLVLNKTQIPRIPYTMAGKNHYYFPDIFIPHENKIIEVKSTYTYNADLEKNKLKQAACLSLGYLFEFRIYS